MLYGPDNKPIRFAKADYDRDKKTLLKYAKKGCPRCFGRGWVGLNMKNGKLVVCICVNREELVKELMLKNANKQRLISAS